MSCLILEYQSSNLQAIHISVDIVNQNPENFPILVGPLEFQLFILYNFLKMPIGSSIASSR